MFFHPSQQKGKKRKNSETQPLRDKADTTFHYDDKDYIDDSRCGVAHAGMKRLTRHEQMVIIFGRGLVNSGMESGGISKLPLNCAGDVKGVGRTPLAL